MGEESTNCVYYVHSDGKRREGEKDNLGQQYPRHYPCLLKNVPLESTFHLMLELIRVLKPGGKKR